MGRGIRFPGIIVSSPRTATFSTTLSNPTVSTYSAWQYTTKNSITRNIVWSTTIGSDTNLTGGSPNLKIELFLASNNSAVGSPQNVTPSLSGNSGTFTGLAVNTQYYVKTTLTDSYGQVYGPVQSANITTTDYEAENVAYSSTNPETYYETGWLNPNANTATVNTSGSLSGGSSRAFDGSSGTAWSYTGVTGGTWIGVYGESSHSETTAASDVGKNIVSSTGTDPGLVSDSTNFFVVGIRYRIETRLWTRFYVKDDYTGNFLTSSNFPREGTTENINLNAYDSQPYIENAVDTSYLPFVNNTYFEIPYTNSTTNGFADYNVKLPLTEWYYFGVARVANYSIHILQRSSSTFNSWVTDCQAKIRVEYMARRVR